MTTRAFAEIIIDFLPIPGGVTIVKVLGLTYDLCGNVSDGKTTYLELHGRLKLVFQELEKIEKSGGLQSEAVDKFKTALGEYYLELTAYKDMGTIERLVHHRKTKKSIVSINQDVDQLFKMVGLATTSEMLAWRRQYELDMDQQQKAIEELVKNTSELLQELRTDKDKRDALLLLKNEKKRIDRQESTLPAATQAAATAAFRTIAARVSVDMPDWFKDETDVEFDEKPIAHGSSATVHRGMLDRHTPVVVKMVKTDSSGLNEVDQTAFFNEANTWYKLNHPNVVRMFGACHVASRPFLVCDYAANGSMNDFLALKPANGQHMWRLLYEAAQGLNYLYKQSIVHGDVRLSNILVTSEYKALVADFGMSRFKDKNKTMTKRKDGEQVMGNWRWLAPESFTHKPQFASDVYALAMCILEAFVGEPPYAEEHDERVVKAKIKNGERPLRPADMSDRVWTLIERMTEKEIVKRIKLDEVIAVLKECAASEPAPPASVAVVEELPPTTTVSTSATQLLAELTNATDDNKIDAAERLREFTNTPEHAQQLVSTSSIHVLVTALQDSASPHVKQHLADALANIASDATGAKLIGLRGGVAPLVDLLGAKTERLRRSGLRALAQVVHDPFNGTMFLQADGVTALQQHLTNSESRNTLVDSLNDVRQIVTASTALASAVAANQAIVRLCVTYATGAGHADEQKAAKLVLREFALAATSTARTDGLDVLVKTLLDTVCGDLEPDVEP